MFESRISAGTTEKLPGWDKPHAKTSASSYDMEGRNAWNGLANWQTRRQINFSRFLVFAWTVTKSKRKIWKIEVNCQKFAPILWKMLVLGTNWSTWHSVFSEQPCTIDYEMDQSVWQTPESFYILHPSHMWTVLLCGNTAKQCRLGLFQDSDFAGYLEDSKFTSGGKLCIFGSHTFVPISWMRKKQTSVSHS